ncbi:type III secretion system cytoplasmic ring protein SctQ [Telmatospirillum sp. J64-1]|uniref:type III secretion system cytoplasmic ring protein SctQ n=1 Tax=Telmatospirillum sp. J64-1 TaxID=2502183 RepID=UPI00115EE33D|nr:type III secretion system cytoplasmic ring protein SctQ [Telmatospirillum sp. J64-1]
MLDLPQLSSVEAGYFNRLAGHSGAAAIPFLGSRWDFRLDLQAEYDETERPSFHLAIDLGGAKLGIAVEQAVFAEMLRSFDPGGDPASMPEALLLALSELAFADITTALEKLCGHDVRIIAGGLSPHLPRGRHALGFHLRRQDGSRSITGRITADTPGLAVIADLALHLPKPVAETGWEDLPLPLRLDVGWVDLGLSELRSLERNDILLLDDTSLIENDRLILRLTSRIALKARLEGTTLTIEDIMRTAMTEDPATPPAADQEVVSENNAEPLLPSLDDVEIRLTFDIGHQTLTLAELQALAAGFTFDLGHDPRRAVNIRAGGKLVGRGELVQVDERIGVRVVTLSGAVE